MLMTIMRTKAVPQITLKHKDNEQGWPSDYHCNFLEPGIASYEDVGQGVALLKKETMDKWIQTFKNKPVVIDHQDVNPKNFKKKAVGYITNVYYNSTTGWYDCDFIITDDEGHQKINEGWSVSCSFDIQDTLPGGEWHANKYTEEITKGEGLHLALVTSPRYEDCRITKNNSTIRFNSKEMKVKANDTNFDIMSPLQLDKYMQSLSDVGLQAIQDGEHSEDIKKLAKAHMGDRAKKKEEEMIAASKGQGEKKNMVELTKKEASMKWKLFAKKGEKIENDKIDATKVFVDVDGEKIPLSTIMNSLGEDFEMLQESDTIKINGKDVSVGDYVAAYKANKKNVDEEKEKKEDKKEEEEGKDNAKVHCYKCGKKLSDDDKKKDDGRCNDCFPKKKDEKSGEDMKEIDDKKKKDAKKEKDDKEIKNEKNFFVDLENANKGQIKDKTAYRGGAETREDRAVRGKKMFGSKK